MSKGGWLLVYGRTGRRMRVGTEGHVGLTVMHSAGTDRKVLPGCVSGIVKELAGEGTKG